MLVKNYLSLKHQNISSVVISRTPTFFSQRVSNSRRVAIVVVCLSLISNVSRLYATLHRNTLESPYQPCDYGFVWFCFLCIFSDDYFRDGSRSNNESLALLVLISCSAFSLTLTLHTVWTICIAMKTWRYACGR